METNRIHPGDKIQVMIRVYNATESTSHRYRVNDHGNVKLIVE